MKTNKPNTHPAARLKIGAAVLAAAQAVDIELVKPRFTLFANLHRQYVDLDGQVDGLQAQLHQEQVRLPLRETELASAIEQLAQAAVGGGQPRSNPFEAYAAPTPSRLTQMPTAEEAEAVHHLVEAILRSKTAGKAALTAAQAAEQAAQTVDTALSKAATLRDSLRRTRRIREEVGQKWDLALAALKRAARSAADSGAPGLYAALFGHLSRVRKKAASAEAKAAAAQAEAAKAEAAKLAAAQAAAVPAPVQTPGKTA